MNISLRNTALALAVFTSFSVQAENLPFANTGDLFVIDTRSGILRVTPTGNISMLLSKSDIEAVSGQSPGLSNGGIAFDKQRNMYFVDDDQVMKYSNTGTLSLLASKAAIGAAQGFSGDDTDAEGVSVGADGNLFVTDDKNESVLKVNVSSGNVSLIATKTDILAQTGFASIDIQEGIVTGSDGSIYISSEDRGTDSSTTVRDEDAIINISADGSSITTLLSNDTIADPDQFMTTDANGDLIVASDEGETERIFKVAIADGSVSELISTAVLENLLVGDDVDVRGGLAYDDQGNLFIGDSDEDLILKFDSNGVGSVFITEADIIAVTGQDRASLSAGFAFAPVPVPAALWMMLTSLVGLGVVKRKKFN